MLDPDSTFVFDPNANSSSTQFYADDAFEVTVSPNPFTEQINLRFVLENPGTVQFELRTITGELVLARTIDAVKGDNSLTLKLGSDLPSGAYTTILKDKHQGKAIQLIKL